MSKDAPIKDNGDLDLIDWHRVAKEVIAADYNLRMAHSGVREPSEAAKQTALACIQEVNEAKRLRTAGFQSIGGFWCRIEDDGIASYTQASAISRLEKENA